MTSSSFESVTLAHFDLRTCVCLQDLHNEDCGTGGAVLCKESHEILDA